MDPKKLKKALKAEEKRIKQAADVCFRLTDAMPALPPQAKGCLLGHALSQLPSRFQEVDERGDKRKYNSMDNSEVTEEDLEAYRLKRVHFDDPMLKMKGALLLYGTDRLILV